MHDHAPPMPHPCPTQVHGVEWAELAEEVSKMANTLYEAYALRVASASSPPEPTTDC